MSLLLGSIFQSLGVTVHYSTIDCDDTIAAFAYHMNGSVLSRDCDFFRYYVDYSGLDLPIRSTSTSQSPMDAWLWIVTEVPGDTECRRRPGKYLEDCLRPRVRPSSWTRSETSPGGRKASGGFTREAAAVI